MLLPKVKYIFTSWDGKFVYKFRTKISFANKENHLQDGMQKYFLHLAIVIWKIDIHIHTYYNFTAKIIALHI